jgi:hypothetical protein
MAYLLDNLPVNNLVVIHAQQLPMTIAMAVEGHNKCQVNRATVFHCFVDEAYT